MNVFIYTNICAHTYIFIYIYTYIYIFFFGFFSLILSIVPCAIQQVVVVDLFYI